MGCACSLTAAVGVASSGGQTLYRGCRLGSPIGPITFCTGPSSYRLRPGDLAGTGGTGVGDRLGWWCSVVVGDLVQVRDVGDGGGVLRWWQVLVHRDDGALCIGGDGGAVVWAKPNPTPYEAAHGWGAVDPWALARIVSQPIGPGPAAGGVRMGGPPGGTGELGDRDSPGSAVALVRDALGGREILG